MILIESHGSIYKLADREYRSILTSIAGGFGYRINPKRYLGEVACNLNELTPTEAQNLLRTFAADRSIESSLRKNSNFQPKVCTSR